MEREYKIARIEGDLRKGQRFLLVLNPNQVLYYAYEIMAKGKRKGTFVPSYRGIAEIFGIDFNNTVIGGGICDYSVIGKSLGFWPEFEVWRDSRIVHDSILEMDDELLEAYQKIDPRLREIEIFDMR